MPGHNRHDAASDQFPERIQFYRIETIPLMRYQRNGIVRIDLRITMPGVMFRRRDHISVLHAMRVRVRQLCDKLRIFTQGTDVDDGILRVVVDVGNGCVILVYADCTGFLRNRPSHRVGEQGIPRGGQGHHGRKFSSTRQSHSQTVFEVG